MSAVGNGLATDGSPAKEAFTIGLSSPGIAKSKHSAAHSGRPAFSMHGRKTPGKSRLSRQAQPGCNDLTGEGVEKLSKLRPVDVDLTTDSDPVQQRQPAVSLLPYNLVVIL